MYGYIWVSSVARSITIRIIKRATACKRHFYIIVNIYGRLSRTHLKTAPSMQIREEWIYQSRSSPGVNRASRPGDRWARLCSRLNHQEIMTISRICSRITDAGLTSEARAKKNTCGAQIWIWLGGTSDGWKNPMQWCNWDRRRRRLHEVGCASRHTLEEQFFFVEWTYTFF